MYVGARLKERGILFEVFLRHPHEIAQAVAAPDTDDGFLPLLPAQRTVQARLDLDDQIRDLEAEAARDLDGRNAVCRDGAFIEPLHHHAWPRKRASV